MKVLLDECVPWPMHKFLSDHECATAQQRGWGGIKNGDLLKLAEAEFDIFITSDQNIRYQQNLAGFCIGILELSTNDLHRIIAAEALIHSAIAAIQPSQFLGGGTLRSISRNFKMLHRPLAKGFYRVNSRGKNSPRCRRQTGQAWLPGVSSNL